MLMKSLVVSCGLALLAGSAYSQESGNSVKGFLIIDAYNVDKKETEVQASGVTTTMTTNATRSVRPGKVQLGILAKGWGILAELAPNEASPLTALSGKDANGHPNVTFEETGLFAGAYAVAPGQYIGAAFKYGQAATETTTPAGTSTTDTTFNSYGLAGYHLLPAGPGRLTALWFYLMHGGAASDMEVSGSTMRLTLKYNYALADNLFVSPGFTYSKSDFKVLGMDVAVTETNFEPLSFSIFF